MKRAFLAVAMATLLCAGGADAAIKILKHDQFSDDISAAVAQINGKSLAVQPAFAKGEAFGQVYKLSPAEFPVKIRGLQMVMGAPPNNPNLKTHFGIEFYYDTSDGPAPSKAPDWAIDTTDLYDPNTGATGVLIQGGVGIQIEFDWETAENHPPLMTSGNLWIVLRYILDTADLFDEWGLMECMKIDGLSCGCQNAGLLLDEASTPNVNLINYYTGGCSGSSAWKFLEGVGVKGDPILRVKVETSNTCVSNCSGKNCGDDGCGGSCGTCGGDQQCVSGMCVGPCQPDCTGKNCGDDGCGGSCGTCTDGKECKAGECVKPCVADCTGMKCGDDGCGGSCGTCAGGQDCVAGECVTVCTKDCAGKECGDDGCGGVCGSCGAGKACQGGQCVAGADKVEIIEISPNFGYDDVETPVSIVGSGFKPGLTAKVGGTTLSSVQVSGNAVIQAVVPAGMEPGLYMVVVVNSDQTTGFLANAYQVRKRETSPPDTAGDQDSGCVDCAEWETGTGGGSCSAATGKGTGAAPYAFLFLLVAAIAVFRIGRAS